uniref:Troponin I 4 n=1 Tax=Panagrellus redivivus TaxID=6233 RepID=A0A7E4VDI7_PANRE
MSDYTPIDDELLKYGGPQAELDDDEEEDEEVEDEEDDARRAAEERERKKAEVRKRLEEAGRMKNAKKGFLTPERKKKLRKLLMLKAAEDLKQQQRKREQERAQTLQKRILPLPDLDAMDEEDAQETAEEFAARILQLESDIYDMNYAVRQKDFEINELTIAVNDLRGKFVKPTLKKVSKTEGKFDKLKKNKGHPNKVDLRQNLKNVGKKQYSLGEVENTNKGKIDWSAAN